MPTMIVSPLPRRLVDEHSFCVSTPLDAIVRLERRPIATVILVGPYATDPELAAVLGELYPSVRIEREVPDVATR
jgi:hypothetical protein